MAKKVQKKSAADKRTEPPRNSKAWPAWYNAQVAASPVKVTRAQLAAQEDDTGAAPIEWPEPAVWQEEHLRKPPRTKVRSEAPGGMTHVFPLPEQDQHAVDDILKRVAPLDGLGGAALQAYTRRMAGLASAVEAEARAERQRRGRASGMPTARAARGPAKASDPALIAQVSRLRRQRGLKAASIAKIMALDPRTVRSMIKKLEHP